MSLKKGQCIGGIRTVEDVRQRCYVHPETGCWHWRLCLKGNIPQATINGKNESVRRWVYAQGSKLLRAKTMVVPSCGNRDCVSPDCSIGKEGPGFAKWLMDQGHIHTPAHKLAVKEGVRRVSKLNPAKAIEVARRVRAGEDRGQIAADAGITRNYANKVARGGNWAEFVDHSRVITEAA